MKAKPDLSFWSLWNISFGFFGVQIAYALQNANISRIFSTLGADPHNLSYFWILPPLMGMIVQPLIGRASDKTWCRFGRRIPYLFVGSLVAIIIMVLLPNAGSFVKYIDAMAFGIIALMMLDVSINMAMQPFKMMVGDLVNEKQKGLAYSIQSFLCNAGSLMGYFFPFIFTAIGIKNIAAKGLVPDSVIWSFYCGAFLLILCVIYTTAKVHEMPPKEFAEYHGFNEEKESDKSKKDSFITLIAHAPKAFWTVGLVQFFCWAAFMYMWTYTNGAIADNIWHTQNTASAAYQEAGNWVGILFAVQAIGSVCWAIVIPLFKSHKLAYVVSLIIGGIGFLSIYFITDQYMLFISYFLIGCAWAAMLALPFTIVTNAVSGKNMGTYLGLFNCTICVPQIIAAILGGLLLQSVGGKQAGMLFIAGIFLFIGALCVNGIKETIAEK